MRLLLTVLILCFSAEASLALFKGYESDDSLVIVIPDNAGPTERAMAMRIAQKFSRVYPEDYIKEESYVDRFKLNFYSKYAVIMLGQFNDFKVMKSYKFFPWRHFGNSFYSLDYGLVEGEFSFVYTGDNPYSVGKSMIIKQKGEVLNTPFVYLGGNSDEALEKSFKLFFDEGILSALTPLERAGVKKSFSRLKANQYSVQKPKKESLPSLVKVPESMRFVGVKQGSLKDYAAAYEQFSLLPKQIVSMKYLSDKEDKDLGLSSFLEEVNVVKILSFDYPQQAISAYKKLKKLNGVQSCQLGAKIYLSKFKL